MRCSRQNSRDHTARGNWYTQSKLTGKWHAYNNNVLEGNQLIKRGAWPDAAKKVMVNAGVQKEAGAVAYSDAHYKRLAEFPASETQRCPMQVQHPSWLPTTKSIKDAREALRAVISCEV